MFHIQINFIAKFKKVVFASYELSFLFKIQFFLGIPEKKINFNFLLTQPSSLGSQKLSPSSKLDTSDIDEGRRISPASNASREHMPLKSEIELGMSGLHHDIPPQLLPVSKSNFFCVKMYKFFKNYFFMLFILKLF